MSYGKSIDFLFNQMRNFSGSLASGTITFYSAGTTTPKAIYLDRTLATEAANPYTLSADGTAELFASGVYRVVIKNAAGVTVYDYDNVEFLSGESTPVSDGSTFVVVEATADDATYELGTGYNQIVAKSGDSAHTVTITTPVGYSFADGVSEYVLYANRESVNFVKSGAVFYRVL